ncbi:MAG: hypothetical protein OEY50_03230, partial [Nitrospinota bacterium]|nr:hypothetical protein [Nitrospinota bacterium]
MDNNQKNPSPLYSPRSPGGATPHQWEPPMEERPFWRRFLSVMVKLTLAFSLLGAALGGVVGYSFYVKYSKDLPDIESLRYYKPSLVTRIYDTNDQLAAEYFVERRILLQLDA